MIKALGSDSKKNTYVFFLFFLCSIHATPLRPHQVVYTLLLYAPINDRISVARSCTLPPCFFPVSLST